MSYFSTMYRLEIGQFGSFTCRKKHSEQDAPRNANTTCQSTVDVANDDSHDEEECIIIDDIHFYQSLPKVRQQVVSLAIEVIELDNDPESVEDMIQSLNKIYEVSFI